MNNLDKQDLVPADAKSPLSVSDWIAFLSSEKHGWFASWLSAEALLVAILALNPPLSMEAQLITGLLAIAAAVSIFFVSRRRVSAAQKLLENIMSGKYIDAGTIYAAWLATKK